MCAHLAERDPGADQRFLQPQALGDADAAVVEEGAASLGGGEQLVLHRIVDHRVRQAAAVLHADRDAILRKAVDEVGGAVERIDDPDVFGLAFGAPGFLGMEVVVGIGVAHDADDRLLGRLVHLGDEVVGPLGLHLEAFAAKRGAVDDRAGLARRANRYGQDGVHKGGVF